MLPPNLDIIHAMCGMTPELPKAQGYDANGSPVDEVYRDTAEQLSRDLIEAARDAQGG